MVVVVVAWDTGDPANLESLEDGRKKGNYKNATDNYIEIL